MATLEHSNRFHMAKRIIRLIAPDFHLFSTKEIPAGSSALDLRKKTIEVGETSDEILAVACVMFQLGHLRLRDRSKFKEHSGNFKEELEDRKTLLDKLSKQGADADKLAAQWATKALQRVWYVPEGKSEDILESMIWSKSEWLNYYQSA